MRNYIGYIIDYSDGKLTDSKNKWFESELAKNKTLMEQYELFDQVKETMRAKFDLEDVISDPELLNINPVTSQMVLEFRKNTSDYTEKRDFINSSLLSNNDTSESQNISEHSDSALNSITKQWVEDWDSRNPKNIERREFISASLDDERLSITPKRKSKSIALIISGIAAASIAIFIVLNTLKSNSPESLYQEYYKPLSAFTTTTRNNINAVDPFSTAVEKYKEGQFQAAGTMFSDLIYEDPTNIKYKFFSGITQLQLNSYEQAIKLLNQVVQSNGEYKKEAQWYLGLAYLKNGDIDNASKQLEELAEIKGYYQKTAQDLLKRLK